MAACEHISIDLYYGHAGISRLSRTGRPYAASRIRAPVPAGNERIGAQVRLWSVTACHFAASDSAQERGARLRTPRRPIHLLPLRSAGPRAVGRLGSASPPAVARAIRKSETRSQGPGAMKHTPPATEPIVFECDLPHSPALVWRALTDRDLLGAWLLPNDMRPEVGARFSFERPDQQPGYSIECEVLEVEPNRTLQWRQTE